MSEATEERPRLTLQALKEMVDKALETTPPDAEVWGTQQLGYHFVISHFEVCNWKKIIDPHSENKRQVRYTSFKDDVHGNHRRVDSGPLCGDWVRLPEPVLIFRKLGD